MSSKYVGAGKSFSSYIDLLKNELRNARIQNLPSPPVGPVAGQMYYDTGLNQAGVYNGTTWLYLAVGVSIDTTAGDISDSAVGDTKLAGANGKAADAAHRHSREGFGVPGTSAVSDANANGTAVTVARSDHKHGREGTAIAGTSAVGDVPAVGVAATVSLSDHKHGREGFAAPTGQTAFGAGAITGVSASVAHADHAHGTPTHLGADHTTISISSLATPTADVSWNAHKLTNLVDPTAPQDAATKNYVDSAVQGLAPKGAAAAATTVALPANTYANGASGVGATLTAVGNVAIGVIDGYAVVAGDILLVKNEATAANNGLYVVTQLGATGSSPYILTRASNNDTLDQIVGAYVFLRNGTVNANQGWVVDSSGPYVMGATAITWSQFSGGVTITAGIGITKTGNQFSLDTAWIGQVAITTVGVITVGTWQGTTIAIANGGTGATTAAGAKTNLGFMTRYEVDLGDGVATSIVVTHNLGTRAVVVSVYDSTSFAEVEPDIVHTSANVVTITFATAPTAAQYHCVVIG